MKRLFFLLCLTVVLFSCSRNPLKINTSTIRVDLKIKHLDIDLMKLQQDQVPTAIPVLKNSYGDFFDIFTYRMIDIGGSGQENFSELLYSFVSDSLNQKLKTNVAETIDTIQLRKDLENAFKHYKYYFPEKEVPVVYTCISGFHQSVVTAEKLIGISLEKYLGANSRYYKQLGLPVYKRRNMHPEKIVPDMMYAWAVTEWPKNDNANSLLSQMIQEGKMLYFLDAMLPDLSDTLKIGFTKKQLDFCHKNEAPMWTYLAEHKLLFSTNRMDVKHFIDDGPYTSSFTDESPGRTGAWLGWQIVRSYMKEHPETKLSNLMNNTDFQSILNQSGYQP
jgi:gliding motility-associated lipoprotein GldB